MVSDPCKRTKNSVCILSDIVSKPLVVPSSLFGYLNCERSSAVREGTNPASKLITTLANGFF